MISPDSKALSERRVVLLIARAVGYLVYAYLIVVEIILLLGFVLLLFGANPSAGFTEWSYRNLDRVMSPFRGIFTPIELGTAGNDVQAVFDTSVLFAMIVYGIVALALSALIAWLSGRIHQIDDAETELRRREEHQAQLDAIAARQSAAPSESSPGDVPSASPLPGTEPGGPASPPHEP
jgi:hypothetical protein